MNQMKYVALALLALLVACSGALSEAQVAQLNADEENCVNTSATKLEADACRQRVRLAFCSAHPGADSRCPTDGGAE